MIAGADGKERTLMAVIGRLDEQTDAVLIAPLTRKRAPEAEVHTQTTEQTESQPTQTEVQPDDESIRRDEEMTLPVWLL
jgi:molybdopterin-guanine dinucleotide biosynthesis protein